jgi:uncharacterized membrane protein
MKRSIRLFKMQNKSFIKGSIVTFVLSALGFIDATYLTIEHFMNRIPPCTLTSGCEKVLTSSYSSIFGIPVSLIGSLYYLVLLIALFVYFDLKSKKILYYASRFSVLGFIFSLYFVGIQIFALHSYCLYCLISAIISTCIFVVFMSLQNEINHHE